MFNGYAEQVAGLYRGWTWRRTSDDATPAEPLLFVLCSMPLAWLLLRAFGVAERASERTDRRTADELGAWGLRLLLLTLCVTPLAVTLRKPWLMACAA